MTSQRDVCLERALFDATHPSQLLKAEMPDEGNMQYALCSEPAVRKVAGLATIRFLFLLHLLFLFLPLSPCHLHVDHSTI
jgi:hypothetical protein